jgi:hypothetical protein
LAEETTTSGLGSFAFGRGGCGGVAFVALGKTGIWKMTPHLLQRACLPWLSSGTCKIVWQFEHLTLSDTVESSDDEDPQLQ